MFSLGVWYKIGFNMLAKKIHIHLLL